MARWADSVEKRIKDGFLVDMSLSGVKTSETLHCSKAYVDKNGNNPVVGTCVFSGKVVWDEDIREGEWELQDERLRGEVIGLQFEYGTILIDH